MGNAYIPCNKPATKIIQPKSKSEGPYRMCDMCADHSVKNRGMKLVGPYKKQKGSRAKKRPELATQNDVRPLINATAEELITEHNKIEEFVKGENKRFGEFLKPHKERLEEIGNQLLALSNTQKWDSIRTDAGTAYRSTLLNVSVSPEGSPYEVADKPPSIGREALLDFALDHWDDIGNDLLLVSPQKDAVKKFMEANEGKPPPGVKVGWFTRINIRKS